MAVSCSWSRTLIHSLPHTYSTHNHTNCTHDAVHNMHIHRYKYIRFSLNALLCPQLSALKIKRCINKTFPSLEKVHACSTLLSWPRINMRATCHLATSLCASPFLESLLQVLFFSLLSGSFLTVCLFFSVSHRWVLSCISNLWLSESPALHFLLLPWLGTWERGSGLIRYLQMGPWQTEFYNICSFHTVFIINYIWRYALTQHRAAPIWCPEKGWWGYKTVCFLGLSSHLTKEEKRRVRQGIK